MDNNPFRQNYGMYSSPPIGQPNYAQSSFPQQSTMPQTTSTFTPSYNSQWQQPQQSFQTGGYPTNNQQPSLYQLQHQQHLEQQLQQQQQQQPLSATQAPSSLYSMQQQPQPSYLASQPQSNMQFGGGGVSYNPTGYYQPQQQQPFQQPRQMTMSMPQSNSFYGGMQQQQQRPLPQQPYDPSNFYIPPDFGISRSNTQTSSMITPRHPPVDASTLLKSGKVRKVECPVCHKMIEGDDPAINHHVNDHLEYDTWINQCMIIVDI